MNASKELIITTILLILSAMGGVYMVSKGSTKILTQEIAQTNSQVNTVRDFASDYRQLSVDNNYKDISFKALEDKGILPSGITVTGTGSTSSIIAPYDNYQKWTIVDPNAGNANTEGREIKITIDSTNSKMTAQEKQLFEDKLNSDLTKAGGVISDYDASGADGKISVTYD